LKKIHKLGQTRRSASRVNYVPSSRIISLTEHSERAAAFPSIRGSINIFVDAIPLRRVSFAPSQKCETSRDQRAPRARDFALADASALTPFARVHAMHVLTARSRYASISYIC